jgi:hypothetical protein
MSIVGPGDGVKSFGTTATGAPPPCSSSSATEPRLLTPMAPPRLEPITIARGRR